MVIWIITSFLQICYFWRSVHSWNNTTLYPWGPNPKKEALWWMTLAWSVGTSWKKGCKKWAVNGKRCVNQRSYCVKVCNAIRMTNEEGVGLGTKCETFCKILREEVSTPKRLRRESKYLVKVTWQLVVWKKTTMTSLEEKNDSCTIKSLTSQKDKVCVSRKSQIIGG